MVELGSKCVGQEMLIDVSGEKHLTQTTQRPSPRPADVEDAVSAATACDIEAGVVNQNV